MKGFTSVAGSTRVIAARGWAVEEPEHEATTTAVARSATVTRTEIVCLLLPP
jgi:hypothetical protein